MLGMADALSLLSAFFLKCRALHTILHLVEDQLHLVEDPQGASATSSGLVEMAVILPWMVNPRVSSLSH